MPTPRWQPRRAYRAAQASYRRPSTSCMSYSPHSLPARKRAARSAPRANVARLLALCVISTRSPIPANKHGVVTHDVAAAHRGKANRGGLALAGHALRGRTRRTRPDRGPARRRPLRPCAARCRTARPPCGGDAPRRFRCRSLRSATLAAVSSSLSSRLTPTLMLGANTMAPSAEAAAIRPLLLRAEAGGSDHHLHARPAATSMCPSSPSGRVKSISTSAPRRAAARSAPMRTPLGLPSSSPASRPMRTVGALERGMQAQVVRLGDGFHQGAPHPPGTTTNRDVLGHSSNVTVSLEQPWAQVRPPADRPSTRARHPRLPALFAVGPCRRST